MTHSLFHNCNALRKFADVPSGIAAISKVPLEGWLQVLLVAGLIETQLFKDQSFGGFAYATWP